MRICKYLPLLLVAVLILSYAFVFEAVSVNEVFSYADPNWEKGSGSTPDGLWKYEWFARETETFAAMDWNASGKYYESQFEVADAKDTHWYCRIRTNGTNLHPGAQADAVMTFVCPESGKVKLSVNLQRQNDPKPNGNTVRVMLNDEIIPINGQNEHKLEDKSAFALEVTADVKKGDNLRLMLGSQGNSSSDGVNFSGLRVQYLSGDNLEAEKPTFTVTCVGDSITEGYGTTGGFKGVNAFPYVLEGLLDKTGIADFTVNNCGKSATTALTNGDKPYKQSVEYKTSLQTNPDVVIICLGANDSKTANWNAENYWTDYYNLISEYMDLESKPAVYLFYTTYVADQSKTGCRRAVIQDEILPIQDEIAAELGLKIIDLNTLTKKNSTKYSDGVHPNDELQAMMAEYIYNALCSEGVAGLTAANATASVEMIDPANVPSTDTSTADSSASPDSSETSDLPATDSDLSEETKTDSGSTATDGYHPTTPTETMVPTATEGGADSDGNGILWVGIVSGVLLISAGIALWYFLIFKKKN